MTGPDRPRISTPELALGSARVGLEATLEFLDKERPSETRTALRRVVEGSLDNVAYELNRLRKTRGAK